MEAAESSGEPARLGTVLYAVLLAPSDQASIWSLPSSRASPSA